MEATITCENNSTPEKQYIILYKGLKGIWKELTNEFSIYIGKQRLEWFTIMFHKIMFMERKSGEIKASDEILQRMDFWYERLNSNYVGGKDSKK